MITPKKIIVLGGGLSGLTFVYYLKTFCAALNKNNALSKIILVESSKRVGGSIKSVQYDDGIIHELGPRLIRFSGVKANNTVVLIDQLRLGAEIITDRDGNKKGKNERYLYNKGSLQKLEIGLKTIFGKLPHSNDRLYKVLMHEIKTQPIDLSKYKYKDPSIYDFVKHRFGIDLAENISDPLLRGITAGDTRKLSFDAIFPGVLPKEQNYGSIFKAVRHPPIKQIERDDFLSAQVLSSKLIETLRNKRATGYNLLSGLNEIPERLCNYLLNSTQDYPLEIFTETPAIAVRLNEEKDQSDFPYTGIDVRTIDGDHISIEADEIVSCIPSTQLMQLLPTSMPDHHKAIFEPLSEIPHVPVAVVCMEFRNILRNLPQFTNSFGLLTHSKAGSKILGVSFDSSVFPAVDQERDIFRMTCLMGGDWFEQVFDTNDPAQISAAEMEQVALEEVRKIIGITQEPFRVSHEMWSTGIAQYVVGHMHRLETAREQLQQHNLPITLLGQSYDGISVNDVVYSARLAAWKLAKSL